PRGGILERLEGGGAGLDLEGRLDVDRGPGKNVMGDGARDEGHSPKNCRPIVLHPYEQALPPRIRRWVAPSRNWLGEFRGRTDFCALGLRQPDDERTPARRKLSGGDNDPRAPLAFREFGLGRIQGVGEEIILILLDAIRHRGRGERGRSGERKRY